jgi:hypothetical protein
MLANPPRITNGAKIKIPKICRKKVCSKALILSEI